MKLGVFGGTFDPVHVGHLIVAEATRVLLGLDEVLFVTAGQPWFKDDREITPAYHRARMVEVAIEGNPHFRTSGMEIARPGPTYTADTLEELRERRGPDAELYVMVGLDALKEIGRWCRPERILELGTLVGIARPGCQEPDSESINAVRRGASDQVVVVRRPLIGISGSEIRASVAQGTSIKYSVPERVEAYIYEHELYRSHGDVTGGRRG